MHWRDIRSGAAGAAPATRFRIRLNGSALRQSATLVRIERRERLAGKAYFGLPMNFSSSLSVPRMNIVFASIVRSYVSSDFVKA